MDIVLLIVVVSIRKQGLSLNVRLYDFAEIIEQVVPLA